MAYCEFCGKGMAVTRSSKRFCSAKCRNAAKRERQRKLAEAQADTVPMELYAETDHWIKRGELGIHTGIMQVYFSTDLLTAQLVNQLCEVAYHAGIDRGHELTKVQ